METNVQTKPETIETGLRARPPVVVVMGHIDHGKTTLLDHLRKTKVAEREAGGITQAIGAYQIEEKGKRITFIDTPGHEAFSAMRGRGAHVADIAVLVIAADEGVKPQTEEALKTIQQNDLPFVVALTKIDKPNADPMRLKTALAEKAVLLEGFGGNIPVVELSAKTGTGIDTLLETIFLLAELEELKTDPARAGEGVVIESHLDPKRGAAATLLVEDGVVRRGEFVVIGTEVAPIRIFENFLGQSIEEARAADPVRIVGFRQVPALGERFRLFADRAEAEAAAEKDRTQPASAAAETALRTGSKTIVIIVLKTDVLGSKEAIEAALSELNSPQLGNRIVKSEVGDITESDVKLAAATKNTILVGFRVKLPAVLRELAERNGTPFVVHDVIYDLLDAVKATMIAVAPAELRRSDLGTAKLLALFKEERGKQIAGGAVDGGVIREGARFDIVRNDVVIGGGRIVELQSQRKAVSEVPAGQEFGILASAEPLLAVGDTIAVFTEEKVTPTL